MVSETVAEKRVPTVQMRRLRVCGTSPRPPILLRAARKTVLQSFSPASTGPNGDGLAFQEGGGANGIEGEEDKKIDAPDCANSIVDVTSLVVGATGPEPASGDNFRALTCVSENDGTTFLTGCLPTWPGGLFDQPKSCTTRRSETSDPDELAEHNMWNPMLELFCHADIGILLEALADDMVLGIIALTCHFALDTSCDKSETPDVP